MQNLFFKFISGYSGSNTIEVGQDLKIFTALHAV